MNSPQKYNKKLEKFEPLVQQLKINTGFHDEQSNTQQARAKHSKNHEDSYLGLATELNQSESTTGEAK
jgi:hypothetical protein